MHVPDSMANDRDRNLLEDLRARVRALESPPGTRRGDALAFGVGEVDGRLAAGGLALAALHEISSASPSLADDAAATTFLAGILGRLGGRERPVLWSGSRDDLFAPGLEQAGLGAVAVIHADTADDAQTLAVAEDALREGTPCAVVAETRRASMTATRRLQLAADEAGIPALLLRRWRRAAVDPLAEPSAAATRWRIGCAPAPRPEVGLGRARWSVDLVRQRGGEPFSLVLEACDHEGRLAVPAPARRRAAPAAGAAVRAA